ncbi:hypothetical protein BGZ99_004066 [Dissophora globulifera]|uniref:NAD(P)-binding domain-containing protein n=1 Tax=Dissophora globulifera TaxID=979702 RepID=A0A9P6UV98_9FUNG|nr:hypothetical protein BGZ99_004066 [Dissophora globulifera]
MQSGSFAQSNMTPGPNNRKIALTNADSWLGCRTACQLAQELKKKCEDVQLVCMVRKTEHLDKLKKFKNVHIEKVDYEDEKSLEKAFRGVSCTIIFPEMDEHRAKYARHVIQAMKNQHVKSCMLISVQNAGDSSSHLKEIQSFHEIEKEVQQHSEGYLILRKSILNQWFFLWAPIVQERGEFPISTTKQCEMVPLDVCDLICAIQTIVVDKCRQGYQAGSTDFFNFGQYMNKVYTLTGPQKITAERLVEELRDVTGEKIKIKEVSREELKKYFESLRKRRDEFHEDGEGGVDTDMHQDLLDRSLASAGSDDHSDNDDRDDHHRLMPNEAAINLLLDELELVRKGESGFVSGDLEKITGHSGRTTREFLRKEKDAFKPHRN